MDARMQHGTGNNMMQLKTGTGWSRGMNNVLGGELRHWFLTRTWLKNILLWAACVNAIFLMIAVNARQNPGEIPSMEALMIFNIFMGIAGPIGVSILMQGALVGEKRSGTAAWILSKPVSRTAFILSKLISSTTGIIVTMIIAQGVIAYLISTMILGVTPPVTGFIAALGVHLVNILFYLTLTLMLGAIFDTIAPVIGIPIAFLFGQNFLNSIYPPMFKFLPYTLAMPLNNNAAPSIAGNLMMGQPVPTFLPVISTVAASVAFVVIALLVFRNQEL